MLISSLSLKRTLLVLLVSSGRMVVVGVEGVCGGQGGTSLIYNSAHGL